jgi:hypothetical protein
MRDIYRRHGGPRIAGLYDGTKSEILLSLWAGRPHRTYMPLLLFANTQTPPSSQKSRDCSEPSQGGGGAYGSGGGGGGGVGGGSAAAECYRCGKIGHIARACPEAPGGGSGGGYGGGGGGGGGGGFASFGGSQKTWCVVFVFVLTYMS